MTELAGHRGRALALLTVISAVTILAALACNRGGDELATSTPGPGQPLQTATATSPSTPATSTPAQSAPTLGAPTAAAPTPTQELAPTPTQTEMAERVMWAMFEENGRVSESAIVTAGAVGHPGLVPVLLEAASVTFDTRVALEIANALERITGERVGGDFALVAPWFEWLGQQDEFEEIPGFGGWKGRIYSRIDPSFEDFFYEGVPRSIPLWSPMWGGVRRDGIPPLENPKVIPASEAAYLEPDDPVFGVVVNGEARAYPWRIMAWHELSNDVVGGKHISVVF